jgi:VanZ family protein
MRPTQTNPGPPDPGPPYPDQWILPLQTFPWIFAAAFAASLVPAARRRMTAGPLPWRLLPVLVYAAVISLASSVNPSAPTGVSGKVFHPVVFAGLAFLAQLAAHSGAAPRPRPRWRRLIWVALACMAFGIADELHQSFVPHRTCTALDMGLDALGAVAGTLTYLATHALVTRLTPRQQ